MVITTAEAAMDLSKRALLEFIEALIEKGRINKNTGGGIRAACRKILEQVPDEMDVRHIDVSSEVIQYNNRHPNELSADSLRVYESRVKSVIDSFEKSVMDPTGYKLPGKSNGLKGTRTASKKGGAKDSKSANIEPAEVLGTLPATAAHTRTTTTDTSLALPFPLRPTFLAQVVVPRDMTKEEAKRLSAFLDALAHDAPSS